MVTISGIAASSLLVLSAVTSASSIPGNNSVDGTLRLPLTKFKGPDRSSVSGADTVATFNAFNEFYGVTVWIGSEKSLAYAQVDTGSSDLIVKESLYNAAASSTSKNLNTVGRDWGLNLTFYTDDVTVAGAPTLNLEFATDKGGLTILGIGPLKGEATRPHYTNFPYALAAAGHISKPAFSIYLENEEATDANDRHLITNSEIIFGGIDHNKYEGELASFPILSSNWPAIQLDNIKFGDGSVYEVNVPACIDTGTTTAAFPKPLTAKINATFGPTYPNGTIIDYQESWNSTNFEFNFGSKLITVPYTNFLMADGHGGWKVRPIFDSEAVHVFVVGDTILRNIYSVYDYELNTISIAQSKPNAWSGPANITNIP